MCLYVDSKAHINTFYILIIMYKHYNELKEALVIREENKNFFEPQTETERLLLKEGLLFHKRIKDPLTVCVNIFGLVLVDGHSRWNLLEEVIALCPEFDLNIPLTQINSNNIVEEMIRIQFGRRSVSSEAIKHHIELLKSEGMTANKAHQKLAAMLGKSVSAIKLAAQPELAQKNRERAATLRKEKSENKSEDESCHSMTEPLSDVIQTISNTPDTPPHSELPDDCNEDDTYSPEEIDERNSRYSTTTNKWGEEVVEYTNNFVPTKEQELQVKLSKHLPQVEELESILPSFAEHAEVKSLISTFIRKYKKYIND